MIDLSKIDGIFLYTGKTDLRASIFGLSLIIQESFPIETMRNKLFVFCNKDKRNIKIIELDYDGFWLYQKKLHKGKFRWPKLDETSVSGILKITNWECGRFIGLVLDNLSYIHFYSNNLIVF